MADQRISARYASSFLESSIEKNLLDTVSNDIDLLTSVFRENQNLRTAVQSPVVKSEVKASILDEIFKNKIHPETLNFLLFVVKKRREELLYSVLEKFKEVRDQKLGYMNITVLSASEFSERQKDELQNRLQKIFAKKLRMTYSVDENLLGGFIVKAGDTVFNASIKHQLELLKKHFNKANPVSI